jgi:hypothetical protein
MVCKCYISIIDDPGVEVLFCMGDCCLCIV